MHHVTDNTKGVCMFFFWGGGGERGSKKYWLGSLLVLCMEITKHTQNITCCISCSGELWEASELHLHTKIYWGFIRDRHTHENMIMLLTFVTDFPSLLQCS